VVRKIVFVAWTGQSEKGNRREKGQNQGARGLDDWTFESGMEGLSQSSSGAPRQARHRRTQYSQIETQPSLQPGDPV